MIFKGNLFFVVNRYAKVSEEVPVHRPHGLTVFGGLVFFFMLTGCGKLLLIKAPCEGHPVRREPFVAVCSEFSFKFTPQALGSLSPKRLREIEEESDLVHAINGSTKEGLSTLANTAALHADHYYAALNAINVASAELCTYVGGCGQPASPSSYPWILNCGEKFEKDCGAMQELSLITFNLQHMLGDGIPNEAAHAAAIRQMRNIIADLCKQRGCSPAE